MAKAGISIEKILELMESKDANVLKELGGVTLMAQSLGSDTTGGVMSASENDLVQRRAQYGENKLERKPPPSILELFLDAMKDTTIIVLLIAALISVAIGAISCSIHLGKTCPRRPLWDIGYSPGNEVISHCHFLPV